MTMKEVCYAYRDQCKSEELWKHIKDVSDCMKHSYLHTKISKKISWITRGVAGTGEIMELIEITGLLHDIGKSFDELQNGSELTHFPAHDLLGASTLIRAIHNMFSDAIDGYDDLSKYIVMPPEGLKSRSKEKDIWLAMNLVVLPILFHHYAQHEYQYWSGRWAEYLSKRYTFERCGYIIGRLRDQADQYRYGLSQNLLRSVATVLSESKGVMFPVENLIFKIIQLIRNPVNIHPTKYITLAMVGHLNTCDGIVAQRNRESMQCS